MKPDCSVFYVTFFVFYSQAGFFKSKYNEMINEAGGGADPGADGDAATPEQLTWNQYNMIS